MSTYEPCPGSGLVADNRHTANPDGTGPRFVGQCPHCGRSPLVLVRGHWLHRDPAQYIPRHKSKTA